MPQVALQLLWLGLLTLPLTAAGLLAAYRLRHHACLSERLLALLLAVPLAVLGEVFLLTRLPIPRPLDWLPHLHIAITLAATAWCFRHRRTLAEAWTELRTRITSIRASQSGSERLVITLGLIALLAASLWGLWTVPFEQDAAGYHLPQALQPWQDGQLGTVYTELSYADSYPRSSALLWFWTLSVSGTDAGFDLVASWFGAMTCLAGYIMARRGGATSAIATCCALLVPTLPMFGLLATIKQIDLHTTGLIAAAMALALPRRNDADSPATASTAAAAHWPAFDAILAAAMLILAMWMKFLPIAMIGLVGTLRIAITLLHAPTLRSAVRPLLTLAFWGIAVALASSPPYIQTWLQYGTPVYPYKLELLGHTIFDGPLSREMISGESAMAWADRYRIFWIDWTHPLGPQQPSGFGPAWPLLLLLITVIFTLAALAASLAHLRPNRSQPSAPLPHWTSLGLLCGFSLAAAMTLPHHHWSRYTLWLAPVAAAALAVLLSTIASSDPASNSASKTSTSSRRPLLTGFLLALAGLQFWGSILFWQHTVRRLSPLLADSSASVLSADRMWALLHESYRQDARSPSPATRCWIFQHMPDNATRGRAGLLVTTVAELQGLLHDPTFRFAVEYHTPARRELWQDQTRTLTAGAENAASWLATIRALAAGRPLMVLCYTGSTEDLTLAAPGSGFRLGYEQPARDGPNPVRVYVQD